MAPGLDVIILDDEPQVAEVLSRMIADFYSWGEVHTFSDYFEARTFCFERDNSVAIFVLDVFLGERSAFDFIEELSVHYPMAAQDSVVVTGQADEDIVDMCVASGVNHLLEKPVRRFALQFAIRAIASKYLAFSQRLLSDAAFAEDVGSLEAMGRGKG